MLFFLDEQVNFFISFQNTKNLMIIKLILVHKFEWLIRIEPIARIGSQSIGSIKSKTRKETEMKLF